MPASWPQCTLLPAPQRGLVNPNPTSYRGEGEGGRGELSPSEAEVAQAIRHGIKSMTGDRLCVLNVNRICVTLAYAYCIQNAMAS